MGTSAEWPTFRRIVVDVFQSAGQVLNVGQEASSLTGILGLVTAGVGITIFCGMPRFCGEQAIVSRPIVTETPTVVETHLAWRRASICDRDAPLHRDQPDRGQGLQGRLSASGPAEHPRSDIRSKKGKIKNGKLG